jgi:hypothetical protein
MPGISPLVPNSLDIPYTYIVIAPVITPGRFRVRVPGHALRDLDTPYVRQVVRNPRGAEHAVSIPASEARRTA